MVPKCKRCKKVHAINQFRCDDSLYPYSTRKYPLRNRLKRAVRGFIWKRLRIDFTSEKPLHWWREKRKVNIRIGRISKRLCKWLNPTMGACYKCGTTWRFVSAHHTKINQKSSVFPLCKKCWAESTTEERINYYMMMISDWIKNEVYPNLEDVLAIQVAVEEGK